MVFCVLLAETELPWEKHTCRHRLFRSCRKACGGPMLRYMGAVSIILQYHKLLDDVHDGKGSRRFLLRAIRKGYRKAKADHPEIERRIADTMAKLQELEQRQCGDWEQLDRCFPQILYDIFDCAPIRDEFTQVRGMLSRHVAAWVYWFDMLQDLEQDRHDGSYNAILLQGDEARAVAKVRELLYQHLADAEALCDLLPYSDETEIIRNIVTMGLPGQMLAADTQGRKSLKCARKHG
ncbi:MAG: hypothetical protein IKY17_05135 [Oscillospiraceae bacterium]|nr:hypothetical protein [Oscillospiraceae bacterium]